MNMFDAVFLTEQEIKEKDNLELQKATFNNKIPIWIFWDKGWDNAPLLSKICLQSWYNNHDYNSLFMVVPISNKEIDVLLDLSVYRNKHIDPVAFSDIVRITIINQYGGIWADSTVLCLNSLDSWLLTILQKHDFWAYGGHERRDPKLMSSSWFLASVNNSFIVQSWNDATINYWKNRNHKHDYFWFFHLFYNLYRQNIEFKTLWDNTPHLEAFRAESGPHFFAPYLNKLFGDLTPINKNYIQDISKKTNVLKLTRHPNRGYSESSLRNPNTTIYHLLKQQGLT